MKQAEKILTDSKQLFMRYGIRSVTMDDIAKHLTISKKTLYQFFRNKEDLIDKILVDHVSQEKILIEKLQDNSEDAIDELLSLVKYVITTLNNLAPTVMYDLKKYYQKPFHKWDCFHRDHIYEVIQKNLERGVNEELYRDDIKPQILARIYVEFSILVTNGEIFPPDQFQPKHLYRQFIKYHIYGIISEQGRIKYYKHLAKHFEEKL